MSLPPPHLLPSHSFTLEISLFIDRPGRGDWIELFGKGICRERRSRCMMKQTFGISVVGVAILMQLMFLPTRSLLTLYHGPDRPRMSLPIASEGSRSNVHCHEEMSWTRAGGWVAGGVGSIKVEDLESFLRRTVERCQDQGIHARVRVRIPPDAPASEFVHLARCMERAGVIGFNVAVIHPDAPWI